MGKRVFVTVGSTRFPELIKTVMSEECVRILLDSGYTELCVQYGSDVSLFRDFGHSATSGIVVTGFDYSPSIEKEMREADLVVSHAGSGSILEVLHLGKLLIAVPNSSLMDNHQAELAKALSDEGYLLQSRPDNLPQTLASLKKKPKIRPFKSSGAAKFAQILDEELGLV